MIARLRMRPGLQEWFVLVVSLLLAGAGTLGLQQDPWTAIAVILFFGICAAVALTSILGKLRTARRRLVGVAIAGGVPIRPSRSRAVLWSAAMAAMAMAPLLTWSTCPQPIRVAACLFLALAAVLLAGSALGLLPAGYLQFDPEGITFGNRGWRYVVPWDGIRGVAPAELHGNPVLLIQLVPGDVVRVFPASCQARLMKSLRFCERWFGAPVTIMPEMYGVDLPTLAAAVVRYTADAAARAELRPLPALAEG